MPNPTCTLTLTYTCPSCGHTWHDTWDCAVDADCPQCEARAITPLHWTSIGEHPPTQTTPPRAVFTPGEMDRLTRVGAIDNAHALRAALQEFGVRPGQTIELASMTITLG